jgi:hypothetical protein
VQLKKHTQNTFLGFHFNVDYVNLLQHYVIRTLPFLLQFAPINNTSGQELADAIVETLKNFALTLHTCEVKVTMQRHQ